MKILNLYSGIGGNRKYWKDCEVTAVELNADIANIYQDIYPNDRVIVGDAHDYLLHNYKKFDFIWSSPPCPTHAQIRRCGVQANRYEALYPDRKLWEEILLLQHFSKCKWVIENVRTYYKPLVQPSFDLDRHYFWSNFNVKHIQIKARDNKNLISKLNGLSTIYGFNLNKYIVKDKRGLLRNLVNPTIGLHILNQAQL